MGSAGLIHDVFTRIQINSCARWSRLDLYVMRDGNGDALRNTYTALAVVLHRTIKQTFKIVHSQRKRTQPTSIMNTCRVLVLQAASQGDVQRQPGRLA